MGKSKKFDLTKDKIVDLEEQKVFEKKDKKLKLINTAVICPRATKGELVTLESCQGCDYHIEKFKKEKQRRRDGVVQIKITEFVRCLFPVAVQIITVNEFKEE